MSRADKPCALYALNELPRLGLEIGLLKLSRKWLSTVPRGDGHGVMLIPGFLGDDKYNTTLLTFLNDLGYDAVGWGLGQNLGPRGDLKERLGLEFERLVERTNNKVTLIGHSLGGIYAREVAREAPEFVRQVITLGSPINQGRDAKTSTARLFKLLNPRSDEDPKREVLQTAPPVPTTSVYTKSDGVVHWKNSLQALDHDRIQNIRVYGSHCGLTANASVWALLAERLTVADGKWQPFEKPQKNSWLYPDLSSGHQAFFSEAPLHA